MFNKLIKKLVNNRLRRRLAKSLGEGVDYLIEDIFYESFLWTWFCKLRKVGRFVAKLPTWLVLLWQDEDWDYSYLLDIIKFKLIRMEKCLRDDDIHLNSDKRAREVKIVLSHLDHYRDIDKYTESEELVMNFKDSEDNPNISNIFFDSTPRGKRLRARQMELEGWHYQQFFKKLSKHLTRWWS